MHYQSPHAKHARGSTYISGRGVSLKIGLDGLVLFVKVRQVRDEVLDDVGVRQGVQLDLGRGLGGDSACGSVSVVCTLQQQLAWRELLD